MRTIEFTAPTGSKEDVNGDLGDLAGLSNINAFQSELFGLSQSQLKSVRENLTAKLGIIEGEIKDDSRKLWYLLLTDLSNEIRAKLLAVTNLMEGGTINPNIH